MWRISPYIRQYSSDCIKITINNFNWVDSYFKVLAFVLIILWLRSAFTRVIHNSSRTSSDEKEMNIKYLSLNHIFFVSGSNVPFPAFLSALMQPGNNFKWANPYPFHICVRFWQPCGNGDIFNVSLSSTKKKNPEAAESKK